MAHSRVLNRVLEMLQANVSGLWGFFIRKGPDAVSAIARDGMHYRVRVHIERLSISIKIKAGGY